MKRKILIAVMLVLLMIAAAGVVYAQVTGYTLPWWAANGGGGDSAGGNYRLSGTIGQPDVGALEGGDYRLEGGFWGGSLSGAEVRLIYLPVIRK
jgi:hypothetical protein